MYSIPRAQCFTVAAELVSVSGAQGLACWPGTVGKSHYKHVLAEVFAQKLHFCSRTPDTYGHIVVYSMLSLCHFSSLPGVGLIPMGHLTLKTFSSFLTETFFSSFHGSVLTSFPLPSVENFVFIWRFCPSFM